VEKQFDSLDSYIGLAKKTISKFAPKFYNGLSSEMLKSEEAISDVATALMYADWRFDSNREGKTGLKKTLYSYRNQCAIWAIKTYMTNKYKKKDNLSLDHINGDMNDNQCLNSMIEDPSNKSPLETLIDKESAENLSQTIGDLLNNSILTDKQRAQIKMYYFDDKTLSEIGKEFGVSREAIRQSIKRGLDIIKTYDKCHS
jgi:RNA polymerase sigma factor (sigma-70 family)